MVKRLFGIVPSPDTVKLRKGSLSSLVRILNMSMSAVHGGNLLLRIARARVNLGTSLQICKYLQELAKLSATAGCLCGKVV